jgi:hypothetical protein
MVDECREAEKKKKAPNSPTHLPILGVSPEKSMIRDPATLCFIMDEMKDRQEENSPFASDGMKLLKRKTRIAR